jgi:hypothetical protein
MFAIGHCTEAGLIEKLPGEWGLVTGEGFAIDASKSDHFNRRVFTLWNRLQQMIRGMWFERKLVKQNVLLNLPRRHQNS